jgi:TolB-like protein/lipopolysaccharide biosynthesis regulator YciM
MKRCPQCNRVETDDALVFCRVDGARLVSESASLTNEPGTARLSSSSPASDEIETSILPHTTDAAISRGTGPTTVLPVQPERGTSGELTTPLYKRKLLIVSAVVIAIAVGLGGYFLLLRRTTTAIDSIAVLPFQNVSGNADTEYLCDGIAESLINSLTQLQQLKVIARSTAFRYKGKEIEPQAVGRELSVRAVLMGRVRQVGDNLNVQVDLVDAQTGAQLWGEEYERKLSDLVNVKQAITREVTEKLRLKLSGEQRQQLIKRDTTNLEAYHFYLRGRYYWNKRTAEALKKAIEQFQQAVERDPNYALGYVGLADCYVVLEEQAGVPAGESLPKAKAAVDRALQIDDSLAEAHTSLAAIYLRQWRWAEAEQEFRRAINLNPNYPTAHQWFSQYFRDRRQFDDALREIKRAQELDPLSPIISNNVATSYLLKNDINSALEQWQRIIELDPNFPQAHASTGFVYLRQRRYEEALAEFRKAVELSGRASRYLSDLGYGYAVVGRREEALQILKELEEKYARREAIGMYVAGVYVGLGEKDQAFAWLEKDFQQRAGVLTWITWRFHFDDLRSDPRYADLVRRMGLEP